MIVITRPATGIQWVESKDAAAAAAAAASLQSCPTLCDPIAGSLPGSPVPGILQARTLEWVAISFSILALCIFKHQMKRIEVITNLS